MLDIETARTLIGKTVRGTFSAKDPGGKKLGPGIACTINSINETDRTISISYSMPSGMVREQPFEFDSIGRFMTEEEWRKVADRH